MVKRAGAGRPKGKKIPEYITQAAREMYQNHMKKSDILKALQEQYGWSVSLPWLTRKIHNESWDFERSSNDLKVLDGREVAERERKYETRVGFDLSQRLNEYLEEYQLMRQKGKAGLEEHTARNVGEAGDLVDKGVKGERAIMEAVVSTRFVMRVYEIVCKYIWDDSTKRRLGLELQNMLKDEF